VFLCFCAFKESEEKSKPVKFVELKEGWVDNNLPLKLILFIPYNASDDKNKKMGWPSRNVYLNNNNVIRKWVGLRT
jgi:hypothetical protein